MRAQRVESFIKRREAATRGIERHAGDNIRELQQAARANDAFCCIGAHELRTIDERQAIFGRERNGRKFGAAQSLRSAHAFSADFNFPSAQQRQRHVRQRCEIAAGAERSLRGNDGQNVGIQQGT